jgi:hypothetical protein
VNNLKICPTCGTEYPLSERFCPRDGSALRTAGGESNDLVGQIVAQFHIIKKLGEGGMGQVYLAEHVKMQRKAALKVMNPGMNQDPDAIARFNREANNASKINHPNVCQIFDFGETPDGLIFLAMEFIEGQSLTALIEKTGSLPAPRAASIIHQAADALGVAHDYGIVHRDLKPDNIMIAKNRDGSDMVKVVDFGIAKASTSDAQKVTKTGLVVGTPEYMSPEQLAGDQLDGRSDIYSLGLVAFNCLTGTLPFPSKSAQEAMIMRLTDQPKKLADMKPDVQWPAELQAVMDKALARDANDRYQTAPEFGRDMTRAVEKMPATVVADMGTMVLNAKDAAAAAAMPATRVASASDKASAASSAAAKPTAPEATGGGMNKVGLGVGGLVVVGAIGFFIMKGSGSKADAPAGSAPAAAADSSKDGPPSAPSGGAQPNPSGGNKGGSGTQDNGKKLSGPGVKGEQPGPKADGPKPPASAPVSSAPPEALFDRVNKNSASADDARAVLSQLTGSYLSDLKGTALGTAYAAQALSYVLQSKEGEACTAAKRAQSAGLNDKTKRVIETVISSCQ